MGEVVSLRLRRKERVRNEKQAAAAQARRRSGLTKAERKNFEAEKERADGRLEGHRIEPPR